MRNLLLSCQLGTSKRKFHRLWPQPLITQAIAAALDYLQELEGKTLLLKTTHSTETELGAMELELTWEPPT